MSLVSWLFGIMGLIIIGVLIFGKFKKRKKTFKFTPVKRKPIVFTTPRRKELFLMVAYIGFFLAWNNLQNIILLRGLDYSVTWFGNITTNALDLSIIFLIGFHVVLMILFLMSLNSKATHRQWDIIAGTIAFFGVAIVLAGFINNIYSNTIRFLFINMSSTDFYHIGVGIQVIYMIYLIFTK